MITDPYLTLGIHEMVSDDEVKSAYHAKVREFPPEDFPEQFSYISAAYEEIRTEKARVRLRLMGPLPSSDEISKLAFHEPAEPPQVSRDLWIKDATRIWLTGRLL